MKKKAIITILTTIFILTLSGCKTMNNSITGIPDDFIVNFNDPILEKVVRDKIEKPTGDLTYVDVKGIKKLIYYGKNKSDMITNIGGIEYLTGLRKLTLSRNSISDIRPLKNLTTITYLDLGNNIISDIKPLENLTEITKLFLMENMISDITPLLNNTGIGARDLVYIETGNTIPKADIAKLKAKEVKVK